MTQGGRGWTIGAAIALFLIAGGLAMPARAATHASSTGAKIVGGTTTTIQEWPWQVIVMGKSLCGGSLIDPDIVLTAAHCADGVSADAFVVGAGYTDRSQLGDSPSGTQEIHGVSETVISPAWDGDPSDGTDWALLRLEARSGMAPVALASAANASSFELGDSVWATGWGRTAGPGTETNILREVELTLADCAGIGIDDSFLFCTADTEPTQGTCAGDSGGPLVAGVGGGSFRQIGITSFGDMNCSTFNGFTNVATGSNRDAIVAAVDEWGGFEKPPPPPPGGGDGDVVPPQTTITEFPKRKIKTRKRRARVTISFSSSEPGSSFSCSLDGKPSFSCASPATMRTKRGKHELAVAATDAAGNADASPAYARWRVKRKR